MTNNFKNIINNYVLLIKNKMNTEYCLNLKKNNPEEYINVMYNYVPKFRTEYPYLFKMIILESDLSLLDTFLDNIVDIDEGNKDLNKVRNDLGLLLHNKYINNN